MAPPPRLRAALVIAREAHRCTRLAELGAAVFAAIAADVPNSFACLATLDPANGLITGAVKSRPLPVSDEEFAAVEWGGPDINRFDELATRAVPVGALSLDTDGRPYESRRFREFMAPRFGFTDELRSVCRSRSTAWAAFVLYRGTGEPPFTARDVQALAAAGEAVADAVRALLLAPRPAAAAPPVPAIIIVDAEDRVTDRSAGADDAIAALGGFEGDALPASVLTVAAKARVDAGPVVSRVRSDTGAWFAVRGLPLAGASPQASVVLTIEPAAQAAVGQIALAANGLTARESEVVQLVLQGRSTKAIATGLHLSPHTVQDHLKAVFGKVGVASRRELAARFVE